MDKMIPFSSGSQAGGAELGGADQAVGDVQSGSSAIVLSGAASGGAVTGDHIRILRNGAKFNTLTHRIVGGPTVSPMLDPAVREKAKVNRYELAKKAARRGMEKAGGVNIQNVGKRVSALDVWSEVIEAQTRLAMDVESGRSSTEAAKFVGRAADLLQDDRSSGQSGGQGMQLTLDNDVSNALLRLLFGAK